MALQKDRNDYEARLQKMLEESLINIDELKASSIMDYNITPSKILPHIITVQQLRLEPMIGTALYRKLQEPSLTFEYELLLDNYIYKYLVHQALSDYLKTAGISAKEGGLYFHTSSDGEALTLTEAGQVSKNEDYKAAEYSKRLLQFLHNYDEYYPEFEECHPEGMDAKGYRKIIGGWNLYPSRPNVTLNTTVDDLKYYIENVACADCPADGSIFEVEFYAGNSNELDMGFDPTTLPQHFNTKPPSVTLQANGMYIWVVGNVDFDLMQAGSVIPTAPFTLNPDENGPAFVKGEQDGKFWIRISTMDTYESPTLFGIK